MGNCKILHLLSSNNYTDIEHSIIQSILLLQNNCEISYTSPNGAIAKILRKYKINYLPMDSLNLESISNIITTYSPTIIHAHGLEACFLASKFSRNIEIIAHIHEEYESFHKLSKDSFNFKFASKHFSKIIWPSQESFNSYKYNKDTFEKSVFLKKAVNCEDVIKFSKSLTDNSKTISFDILLFADNINDETFIKSLNILSLLKGRGFSFKCGVFSTFSLCDQFSSYIKEIRFRRFYILYKQL